MKVDDFIRLEVQHQGFDLSTKEGQNRVKWMEEAWAWAQAKRDAEQPITAHAVMTLGEKIEHRANAKGIRYFTGANVQVGGRPCPPAEDTEVLTRFWCRHVAHHSPPLEAYRIFQLIHPFEDGNGRTGKVLLAWLQGKLDDPEMPPDLFGGGVP